MRRKGPYDVVSDRFLLVAAVVVIAACYLDNIVDAMVVSPNQDKQHRTSTPSRRLWLKRAATTTGTTLATSIFVFSSLSLPSYALDGGDINNNDDDNNTLQQTCANGALATERQVPGAYENPCQYLPAREISVKQPNNDNNDVILKIKQRVPSAGSSGLACWNSSLLLSRLLQGLSSTERNDGSAVSSFWKDHPTVLELGCGPGIASLTAAALGATHVIATDGNPAVIELAEANILANQLVLSTSEVETKTLQWGLLDAMDFSEVANLVIGSDLTYNPAAWPMLAESMSTLLSPNGLVIYLSLGHAGFNVESEVDGFLSVAKSRGLETVSPSDPGFPFTSPPEQYLRKTCRSAEERAILDAGVRVSVLCRAVRP